MATFADIGVDSNEVQYLEDENSCLKTLREEQPKINVALKNFLATFLGEYNVGATTQSSKVDHSRDAQEILAFARILSKIINSYSPESINSIEISESKKLRNINSIIKMIKIGEGSITKLLGKSFFEWTAFWPVCKKIFLESITQDMNYDLAEIFIEKFEESLFCKLSLSSNLRVVIKLLLE